jgi:hypothetical protein
MHQPEPAHWQLEYWQLEYWQLEYWQPEYWQLERTLWPALAVL